MHTPIRIATSDERAIVRHRDGENSIRQAQRKCARFATVRVEYPYAGVIRGGHYPPTVGRKGDCIDRPCVTVEDRYECVAGRQFPYPNGLVLRAGEDLLAEDADRENRPPVSSEL